MKLTEHDKTSILRLCGTKGNEEKGVIFLQAMYSCTEQEALKAVEEVRCCPACKQLLVPFNDSYVQDGANSWTKTEKDQWVCNNPECTNFFF